MSEYHLIAYVPYDGPDYLFSGTEEELRDFILKNKGTDVYTTATGRKLTIPAVCGFHPDDLEVLIQGPDIRTYLV